MSLQWKIALAVAGLAAMATSVVGVLSYRSTSDRMYAEIDRSLAAIDPVADFGLDRDHDVFGPPPPLMLYHAQIIGPDGEVVASSLRGWEPDRPAVEVFGRPRQDRVHNETIDGERYRVRTIGVPDGAVQIARPLDELDRVLRSLRTRLILLVVLVTVAAAMIGSLIAARVTAALRRLTTAADTVRETGRLDVTVPREGTDEVSRLGDAFGAMLDSLDRSRAEQQRLVQDAGHELRTPLTSLRTNLDVLRRHPDLPAGQRDHVVADLHDEIEEMVDVVEEIVAVAGGVAIDEPLESFSLGDRVGDVARRFERRTGRAIAVTADESPVQAQPSAIERAISNLIDNAVKFDQSGGVIEVVVAGGTVEVRDRGPGIPDADLAYVFERFHRSEAARSMPGSGLGLGIVHDVVIRNGGTVHAANRQEGGAIVGFKLPLTSTST